MKISTADCIYTNRFRGDFMWNSIEIFLDKIIDEIESSVKSLLRFWKNNRIYFLCSVFYYIVSSLLLGGTWRSFLIVGGVYAVSLVIGFSKLGEKILRIIYRVRPLETKCEKEYIQPLFDEVCANARNIHKRLRKIELCIIDDMTVNAMALGRRTVAVTKGAVQTFSEDELKAIMAHEVGHIAHGDTIASIYAVVGNGIFSVFVMLARLCLILIDLMQSLFSGKYSITSALMLLLRFMLEASIWIFNFGMQIILSINSRKSEFSADMFSYSIGYDSDMIEALYLLEKISLGDNSSIIQKMTASHPRLTLRINKLEALDEIFEVQ